MIKSTGFVLSVLLFLVSGITHANDSAQINEQAMLAEVFPSSCDFSGDFTQTKHIDGLPMPIKSTGDFFFSCGLGLIWNANTPFSEVLLFANATTNFRIDESGEIEALSGKVRYGMSKIFLRLLKGDVEYFADEFSVNLLENGAVTQLIPESEFMRQGINNILIKKTQSPQQPLMLNIDIQDATGQVTSVVIDNINEYSVSGKKQAFEQCKQVYPSPAQWCRMLRSPWRFEK
ncbi:outer membrane lipoprotein carrier protein LolA [Glaciecola siphonariae]|uniref:Outer membrane lipoprotein carrier protein LolA n=1 Tax=Glaciecola siphonariae TaxID=521012 RepID=A0ABV9LVW3_9ALTE